MKKLKLLALSAVALFSVTTTANAATTILATNDFVGITFWVVSMGMIASTVFFFAERGTVAQAWRPSVSVAGLVTGVAFVHYMYMRGIWVETGETPTVYRYIDWIITVPLQIIEFYLILSAVRKVPSSMFWRLLVASLVMLVFGYLGEAGYISALLGWVVGTAAWIYIIYELFSGVGFCNQLFSLETAIYLANISGRKLILLIRNPLCHCGKSNWDYGKFLDFFTV